MAAIGCHYYQDTIKNKYKKLFNFELYFIIIYSLEQFNILKELFMLVLIVEYKKNYEINIIGFISWSFICEITNKINIYYVVNRYSLLGICKLQKNNAMITINENNIQISQKI